MKGTKRVIFLCLMWILLGGAAISLVNALLNLTPGALGEFMGWITLAVLYYWWLKKGNKKFMDWNEKKAKAWELKQKQKHL